MALTLKPLDQQVIVITGASSGIGLATAEAAARGHAKLVLGARSLETLNELVAKISREGGQAIAVATDVTDRRQIERLATAAIQRFGRIDTWINNAGVSIYGRLDQVTEADSRRLFETNFWGVVNGSLVALQHLRAHGGAIINLGSEVSEAVIPLQGMYAASKHAVKGFTDALRVEIQSVDNAPVSITLIQPTAVNTPYPEHARNYMAQEPKLPTPQIKPERVAAAILDAATQPRHHTKVGLLARVNTALANLVPAIGDRISAMQVGRQQRKERPRAPEGTLYRPGRTGSKYGSAGLTP